MNLLLDTHVFLWYVTADPRLPPAYDDAISDLGNTCYLSAASVWEAAIKHQTGKLPLPARPVPYLRSLRQRHLIESLPVDEDSVERLSHLPSIHRDPFDRMLVAQTLQHGLTLLTVDDAVRQYPVPILPAK